MEYSHRREEEGDVLKDEEGMATMRVLGENVASLIKKIKGVPGDDLDLNVVKKSKKHKNQ